MDIGHWTKEQIADAATFIGKVDGKTTDRAALNAARAATVAISVAACLMATDPESLPDGATGEMAPVERKRRTADAKTRETLQPLLAQADKILGQAEAVLAEEPGGRASSGDASVTAQLWLEARAEAAAARAELARAADWLKGE